VAAEGLTMQWQPIETAPKDGTCVLLFYPDLMIRSVVVGWYGSEGWVSDGFWVLDKLKPSHWMPLPDPPA
jgi:hypothetical protein